ncbi:MAG TPA: hypothetical protein VLB01_07705 [Thermodesulfobacteriota bacterium]|nr:hypothetical protein [Thermodesulfobacteriota bacterium]
MTNEFVNQLEYIYAQSRDDEKRDNNKYAPRYIVKFLAKKDPFGKALFYFRNRKDYIALFSNGQLNARDEEDMFKAWGVSEFKDLNPQSVFKELEMEISQINFVTSSSGTNYFFQSYSEFVGWLLGDKKQGVRIQESEVRSKGSISDL